MAKTERVELLIEGGNAKPDAAIAQRLGPMKINLGQVMASINEKTKAFKGMRVPVKLLINTETKAYDIDVGLPPASELIKKELSLEKGSSTPDKEKVANVGIEHVIKITKMKMPGLFARTLKAGVKTIAGTCNSLGILIEGKTSTAFTKDVDAGLYDKDIAEERTEVMPEKQQRLQEQLVQVQERLKKEQEALKKEQEALKAAEAKPEVVAAPEAAPKPGAKPEEAKPGAAPAAAPAGAKEEKKDTKKEDKKK